MYPRLSNTRLTIIINYCANCTVHECYRVLEAGDDVGDAEHDAARVAGEARAGAELLLGQVSQEPEVLACNALALQCSY